MKHFKSLLTVGSDGSVGLQDNYVSDLFFFFFSNSPQDLKALLHQLESCARSVVCSKHEETSMSTLEGKCVCKALWALTKIILFFSKVYIAFSYTKLSVWKTHFPKLLSLKEGII